ncbi:hypothetical protein FA95DRAFT_690517 [Auriscalpium vulgare]|uniref:Uncharacterized protein n=1 Tax=Auriscalpium vulgare TaxID=40419 RepID=A0ACB8RBM1_9AGAM|nr:hypothetical protein FA95DRAFT_690517 [Auriscalpium vulgare]
MGQGSSSSGSRASSRSPGPSFSPLPSPPPSFLPTIAEAQATTDFFNFYLEDDYIKATDPLAPPPVTGAPFDFLGTFANGSSPESASASSGLSPPFSIDPQLMTTPTPSKTKSEFDEDEQLEQEEDEEEDEGQSPSTVAPIKVGGKGKARKGTVQSGGVAKKAAVSAVVKDVDNDDDADDWRPSPEEYKKMSSKEKRQLRNKISARNFRVRRKEYITTLEGDIAERDRLIDAIRTELGSTKSENASLRSEISTLKKALLSGRSDSPMLPPPGPLPAPARATAALVTPNLQKDLPSSPRMAASSKAFWGGSATFGGITPVHTTLIPESFAQPLASVKPTTPRRTSPMLQENLNPLLNATSAPSLGLGPGMPGKPAAFDMFAENNPFTMKMLDAYRMQLWTRMAQQAHQPQQAPPTPSHAPISGLASNLRPHYFTATTPKAAPSLGALLSGKHSPATAASAYPSPPPSPKPTPAQAAPVPTAQHAMLAAMASQTLLQRLGGAFWQAFSGAGEQGPQGLGGKAPVWDTDKIRRVLEGKAVVQVVDVEPEVQEKVREMPVPVGLRAPSQAQLAREPARECMGTAARDCLREYEGKISGMLEESMRALNISKK